MLEIGYVWTNLVYVSRENGYDYALILRTILSFHKSVKAWIILRTFILLQNAWISHKMKEHLWNLKHEMCETKNYAQNVNTTLLEMWIMLKSGMFVNQEMCESCE